MARIIKIVGLACALLWLTPLVYSADPKSGKAAKPEKGEKRKTPPKTDPAALEKKQLQAYLAAYRWLSALPLLDKLIAQNPKDVALYIDRANVRAELFRFDEAQADLDAALRLQPNLAQAYVAKGCIYFRREKYNEALSAFQKALELDPKLAEAYARRGKVYEAQGKLDQALKECAAGIMVDPKSPMPRVNRIGALIAKKDFDAAHKEADEFIAALPDSWESYNNKGICYDVQGKMSQAFEYYDKAIKLAPNKPVPYLNRAFALAKTGRPLDAMAESSRALDRAPDDFYLLSQAARARIAVHDYANAIKMLNKAHFIVPDNVPTLMLRGTWHAQNAAVDNALDDFNEVIRLDPTNARAYMWRAAQQVWKGNEAAAEQDARTCLQLDPALKKDLAYAISTARELMKTRKMRPKFDSNEFPE